MDYQKAEDYIFHRLKKELPSNLYYHDFDHTYDVLKAIDHIAKSENITIVNLYPVFEREFQQNKKSMYLEEDHHLNDYGHELFAKELYNKLVEAGVIDK